VQQDSINFVRFDFVSDDSGVNFYSGSFVNGDPTQIAWEPLGINAPLYVRVRRSGDTLAASYSSNGTSWTAIVSFLRAMTVTKLGPWVGNAAPDGGGPSPAFTGLINYFFNTASPQYPAKQAADIRQPLPTSFVLEPSYPNPFNPTTTLRDQVPVPGFVEIVVYDVLGRKVADLVTRDLEPGYFSVQWDASSRASGLYVARMTVLDANGRTTFSQVGKLLLTK
jgi:hypothetical protein